MKSACFLFIIFILSICQISQASTIRCNDIHAVPRLEASANPEQTVYRNGYFFRMVRMDPSRKDTAAYQRAEKFINVEFMKILEILQKPSSFIEMIKATNHQVIEDSWVMLMYRTNDTENPIGGMAFMVANNPGEKLLMEKELQKNIFGDIIPTEYPIAEIGRVGLSFLRSNANTFPNLIQAITDVMRASLNIRHFYGFTSQAHQKLYEKFGHKTVKHADHDLIPELPEKDVIIEPLR